MMLLAFQDFFPQIQRKRLLAAMSNFENLHEVVTRVNQWIEQEGVRVLNVETLLAPSLPNQEQESLPARLDSPTNVLNTYQIVRVWYVQEQEPKLLAPQTGVTTRLD